eukprot:scaffold109342_cov18-Tisochrysis_lutea.AAC.3
MSGCKQAQMSCVLTDRSVAELCLTCLRSAWTSLIIQHGHCLKVLKHRSLDADGVVDVNGKPNYKGGVLWVCQECLMGIHDMHAPAAGNGVHAPAAGKQVGTAPRAGKGRTPDSPDGSCQTSEGRLQCFPHLHYKVLLLHAYTLLPRYARTHTHTTHTQGEQLAPQPSSPPTATATASAVSARQAQTSSPMSFGEGSQDGRAERTSSSALCGLFRSIDRSGSGSSSRNSNKVVPTTL